MVDLRQVVARAATMTHDLEGLTRPLLEALAKLAGFESTYLTVFDWDRHTQEVRFVYSVENQVSEGITISLPADLRPEAIAGVTRSPVGLTGTDPDSWVAHDLGLQTYVSVPVMAAKHKLYGRVCGASREARDVPETVITVMEFFAKIIADHVTREEVAETEKRVVAAEEKLRSRARFLATAEHMLKTPLTAIEGLPQTLLAHWDVMPEGQRVEVLEAIVRNAEELHRQIDELLIEARADVQARELLKMPVEMGPLVKVISNAFSSLSDAHDVVADSPEGIMASADPAALYQVLGHLLDNAIKYSPGGGTITIRVALIAGDVHIVVIDEGVGVPEEGDIFEAFKRGAASEIGVAAGVGLGLHIVRNLVEAMGGTVEARRNPSSGSTFTVRLPAAP